ncbi:thiamine-phosphate kinase [Photobacterium lutimaris]|uniref:Thiamine-monophosphate kinase n=1 Tax=Photobacterium lutimaris TaxID=388278 RepID=A0A2T3IUJ9_9GAMM|nr:thiamine-phosphate kinase [Photobacterium lutimaris]PSU32058.1 thiamine-phosphate kinase [Photobacterium lutimaris]TDR73712.1 thiamine-phosphate kinase [Photobacterium lutimaris]
MANEFDLIARYFEHQAVKRKDVPLAIGDDCALLEVPEGSQLAVSTDSLVAGTHFLPDADPSWVAHKALASNLSDLAAMGATPAWVSLALTMPQPDEAWLAGFCEGFFALAEYYNVQLVGGDTTKGPLSITLTVHGFIPKGKALTRSGARSGDWIYVTGNLGDSAAGLALLLGQKTVDNPVLAATLRERHHKAEPRILAGQALRGLASAALDISDGLISDLGHILKRSGVAAEIDVDKLPLSPELIAFEPERDAALQLALASGEEYELCFTVPEQNRGAVDTALARSGVRATCIGQLRPGQGISLVRERQPLSWTLHGYDHFAE